MRNEDGRKAIPRQLQNVRSYLGDAGIPHALRYSKNGFPYVLFDPQDDGVIVSAQYRARVKNPLWKGTLIPARYVVFTPAENGRQHVAQYETPYEMLEVLGISRERLEEGKSARCNLPLEERAISVVHPRQEASLVAAMRR